MIDDLPPAARHHTEPGHFQMDTVHSSGGRGGILTLVDPNYGDPTALRRFYMYALPTISQASVTSALRCFRRDLRANGHELKTILTGSIERHNRLLRLYCPKSTNFSKLSPRTLKQTHRLIVHYPHSPKKVS